MRTRRQHVGQIQRLHGDAAALERHLVHAHRLERRGARAQRADPHPPQALDHAAYPVEVVDVLHEPRAGRADHVRLQRGELEVVLEEDVHHGQLAAERVAAQVGAHLVHVIRVRLDEDGHARVLQRGDPAVLVAEVGQGEDHAVELAAVLGQEGGELCRFLDRLDRTVTCGVLVQREHFMAQAVQRVDQLGARAGDEGGGEEPPVAQEEGEGGFWFGHAMVSC